MPARTLEQTMRDQVRGAPAPSPAAPGPGLLLPAIQKAHERSETFGIGTFAKPDYDVLSNADLALKREQNRVLYVHAQPVMETLHEQIVNTQSMIVLTDAQGLILHSVGDDDFLARAAKVALRPGANWAENRQGTNAIGTALAEQCAMVVHGDQHYLAANHFLTCSSVPILDPYGDVIGVLDVTGDHRSYHQHTMALAKMSVQMIENHLFANTFQESLRLSFHGRREFLGTLMEGIVAFTHDGRFLSANRSAQFQLGMPLAALQAHTLFSLFQVTSAQLADRIRRNPDQQVMLNLCNGTVVCAQVQFKRAMSIDGVRPVEVYAPQTTRPAVRQPPQSGLSRLSYLDTGDPQLASVIGKVRKVIGKDIPILITGETGTGKELLAQAIHNDSPRHQGPFVALNCASIPETLIESELFGYEEGAFTGARRKGAAGKLLQADGGTLFLDEIGDMPYPLQVRLLRVLQERHVNPLGSARSIPVDIAVICATHCNLRDLMAESRFREDLYYRLNGLSVRLPPLRERTDLAAVVQKMLQHEACAESNRRPLRISPEVMTLFERCTWPGNFRQLVNLLRTAAAMVDEDGEIRREHLPDDFFDDLHRIAMQAAPSEAAAAPARQPRPAPGTQAPDARLKDIEASAIVAALARHGGNVSAAARALGVSRNFIYRKMPSSSGDASVRD
jgi:sigma-54 dependent transcriptional regulator, acetoin dehydrogenase operon transcriptional activator AcoR